MRRDLRPWELDVIHQEAPRAVTSWVVSQRLGGRLSWEDRRDLARDLLEAFAGFWPSFQYAACVPAEPTRADLEAALRQQLRGLAQRVLPEVVGFYGGGARVTRHGAEQGHTGDAVGLEGFDAAADQDLESEVGLAEIRARIVGRLLALLVGRFSRPVWFRGLELGAGMTAEAIMARDGLVRRQVHYGRDALLRLFEADAVLAAAVEDAGDLGDALHGICAEVLAKAPALLTVESYEPGGAALAIEPPAATAVLTIDAARVPTRMQVASYRLAVAVVAGTWAILHRSRRAGRHRGRDAPS